MRCRGGRVFSAAVAIALSAVGTAAQAGQLAYEGFGPSVPIYANGGTGFAGPWAQGGFNAFASGYVPQESSLRFGKLTTSGGSVEGGAFSQINGAIRNLAQPLGLDNTIVYLGFVLQPEGK